MTFCISLAASRSLFLFLTALNSARFSPLLLSSGVFFLYMFFTGVLAYWDEWGCVRLDCCSRLQSY